MIRTIRYLIAVLFVSGLCSCTVNPPEERRHDKYFGSYTKKHFSEISIENGARQGFPIENYSYLSMTSTLTNVSAIPLRLKISFSKEYNFLRSNNILKSKVFLLPEQLRPDRQQSSNGEISKELIQYLEKPTSLDTIINPDQKVVITFGMLTEMKDEEFRNMELIATDKEFRLDTTASLENHVRSSVDSQAIYLALDIINGFVIPCGTIVFLNSK